MEEERKARNRERYAWGNSHLSDDEFAQKWERELLPAFRAKQPSEPTEDERLAAKRQTIGRELGF